MSNEHPCSICGNASNNQHHTLREMYFGTHEEFEYSECSVCGVLELLNIPEDLSVFYPENYYSFGEPRIKSSHNLKRLLNIPFISLYLSLPRGKARTLFSRLRRIPDDIETFAAMPMKRSSRILDVGCGSGNLLLLLERFGFNNLQGIDKFIEKDIEYPSGLTIRQCDTSDLDESYDIVMSHHVFEHLPNPFEAIKDMARLTKPGGYVYIRMPNADSLTKRLYGTHWMGWDPPRHVFVHTPRTVEILAKSAALEVAEIGFDSTHFQIMASEQYVKGVPLITQIENEKMVSQDEKEAYTDIARGMNALKIGDAMCAVLRKPE